MVLIIVKLKTSSISLLSEHVVVLVGGSCKKNSFSHYECYPWMRDWHASGAASSYNVERSLRMREALESIPRPSKTTFRWDCL